MTTRAPIGLVVAVARNGGIGKNNALPWRIPEDLKRFKALTLGHPVIMGRATHESIGKPLVERRNIVVSTTRDAFPGCEVVRSLDEALTLAQSSDTMPMIIGGARLYAEALPVATHLFLTEVDRDVEADTFFPTWDRAQWREVKREQAQTPDVSFVDLVRE
ncbi:MAG: dihydrofolate reductase [Myxococcales bacterium]|nr:dihydrofolate reductase [Myxococcales bacterium]